jgi:hypothetical protein
VDLRQGGAHDADSRALVVTGTGDVFMNASTAKASVRSSKPARWEKIPCEGSEVLQRLLNCNRAPPGTPPR